MRHLLLGLGLMGAVATSATAQDKAAVGHGEKIFAAQKCSVCHSISGKGNAKGPLDDVGAKLSDEDLRQWLIAPKEMAEKTKSTRKPIMPVYTKLSKEDLDGLIAFLKTLKKP